MQRTLYSRKEAAVQLSVSLSMVDKLIEQGDLAVRRIGHRVLIPRTELEKLARRDTVVEWPAKRQTTRRFLSTDSVSQNSEKTEGTVDPRKSSTRVPEPVSAA